MESLTVDYGDGKVCNLSTVSLREQDVLLHNHEDQCPQPSSEDTKQTHELKVAVNNDITAKAVEPSSEVFGLE